ncbi:MAG TPA: VOC family protein [Thermoanaerobaculia bacterium]|nr:VOC family protein [Thermoanaerobaculia bacterium]
MAAKKKTAKRTAKRIPKKTVRKKAASAAKAKRPKRAKPETLRLKSSSPSLTVNDVEKTLAFYRDVLGFTVKDRWEENGKLRGLILLAGDVEFYVSQDDWKKGRDRRKGEGISVYCSTVQDVSALAGEMKARGAVLDQEPTDQDWGRSFALTDPDGFKVTIVKEKRR